ncbi:MAG: hypothetical protein HFH74_16835 [Lachnospiraceae bacterium]|nr:hypothetical protein [Lachnospiraceae bacterium]
MENFIGECKQSLDFASVSSENKIVNANHLQFHVLVYNIFNWFRCLVLPRNMCKNLIGIVRVRFKLLKITAKIIHTGRYVKFKLYSNCPYKKVFETFHNMWALGV